VEIIRPSEIRKWIFHISDTKRSDFWEGRVLLFSIILSLTYFVLTTGALLTFAFSCLREVKDLQGGYRGAAVLVGLIAVAGPPAWFWYEARAYDDWVNRKENLSETQKERYRETYN
jgi:hypothetical protein